MGSLSMGEFCLFIWVSPASLLEKGKTSHFKISHVSCSLDLDPEGSVLRVFLSMVQYLQTSRPLSALLMVGQSTWAEPSPSPPCKAWRWEEKNSAMSFSHEYFKNSREGRE